VQRRDLLFHVAHVLLAPQRRELQLLQIVFWLVALGATYTSKRERMTQWHYEWELVQKSCACVCVSLSFSLSRSLSIALFLSLSRAAVCVSLSFSLSSTHRSPSLSLTRRHFFGARVHRPECTVCDTCVWSVERQRICSACE